MDNRRKRARAEDAQRGRHAVQPGDLWSEAREQTGRGIERPREAGEDAGVVPGFTTTGATGSQGGRAVHGVAADEEDA